MLVDKTYAGHLRRTEGRYRQRAFSFFRLVDGFAGQVGHPPAEPDLRGIMGIVVDPRNPSPGRAGVEEALGQRVVGHAGQGEEGHRAHEGMAAGAMGTVEGPPVRLVNDIRRPSASGQVLHGEQGRSADQRPRGAIAEFSQERHARLVVKIFAQELGGNIDRYRVQAVP